jgi:putative lipoprotein
MTDSEPLSHGLLRLVLLFAGCTSTPVVPAADAPSVLVAEQVIRAEGRQVPFEFELACDTSRILPSDTCAVQARIEDGGELLFISDTMNPALTRDAPTRVDIVLRRP